MSITYQDPQIVGNTIYVAGQAVAVITAPEGTTLHQDAVSVLSGDVAYQAGREVGYAEAEDSDEERWDIHDEGHAEGFRKGEDEGYHAGHTAGYEEGYTAALKEHGITEEEG